MSNNNIMSNNERIFDIDNIYERTDSIRTFKQLMNDYETNKNNLSYEKGIYVYGSSGIGKTQFVLKYLKEMNYDVVYYDAGEVRNKSIIETITDKNISNYSVMSLFKREKKRIAIVMDEIDGMNNGDKGGITSLIKLIRAKKTKKQRLEETTQNPIICIGNYHTDKKIKELMGVCKTIELTKPTNNEIHNIIVRILPGITFHFIEQIVNYIDGDLRKMRFIYTLYKHNPKLLQEYSVYDFLQFKQFNEDTKNITKKLISNKMEFSEHATILNENDRTIVGLLWHENIIDVISKIPNNNSIPFYLEILNNICFADFIDRVTFQKQIWGFNEMSSIIKTFKTNEILFCNNFTKKKINDIRFTKVLTKYSTEYNNITFIHSLCQTLDYDKKDLFTFFNILMNKEDQEEVIQHLEEKYEIGRLDYARICKYLSKYINTLLDESDKEIEGIESIEENESIDL